jgi:hypothetical protein
MGLVTASTMFSFLWNEKGQAHVNAPGPFVGLLVWFIGAASEQGRPTVSDAYAVCLSIGDAASDETDAVNPNILRCGSKPPE